MPRMSREEFEDEYGSLRDEGIFRDEDGLWTTDPPEDDEDDDWDDDYDDWDDDYDDEEDDE